MKALSNSEDRRTRTSVFTALDRPAPTVWRVLGVLGSSAVFFAVLGLLGGPIEGDASESVYSTWSIAHGNLACAYPTISDNPHNIFGKLFALVAPLYPVVSGAVAAILRIGHSIPFPARSALGTHCQNTVSALFAWSIKSSAILPTIRISYVTWPFLLLGSLLLIRSSRLRRTWWEPVTALTLALTSPVWMCIVEFFHPQDVLAMSFILAAAAAAVSRRWTWCGVAIGIAVATQQFSLLPAVLLLVIVPSSNRLKYVLGAAVSTAVIDLPFVIATSGRALHVILTGSSRAGAHIEATGGSVIWELHLTGALLFAVVRLLPIMAAAILGWWAIVKLGPSILEPVPLVALIGLSLAFRLVFEENLFGYYFMAVAVALVMMDVLNGRVRGTTWAWLGLVTLAFNPVNPGLYSNWTTWGSSLHNDLPIAVLAIGVAGVLIDARDRRVVPYKYAWLLVVLLVSESHLWGAPNTIIRMPRWGWQVILVPTAITLLVSALKGRALSLSSRDDVGVESTII